MRNRFKTTIETIQRSLEYKAFIPRSLIYSDANYGSVEVEVFDVTSSTPTIQFAARRELGALPTYYKTLAAALEHIGVPVA